jgi:crossover junction endodeoxyribonuclease RusA
MIFLNLPLPPSVNTYYRNFRGIMVISKEGRAFKAAVADYIVEYRVPKLGDKKLKITMVLFPRDKRKIDIDNRIKAVLDALEDAGVFDNDFQVDHLEIIRGKPVKGGGIRVMIESIEDTPSSLNESPSQDS